MIGFRIWTSFSGEDVLFWLTTLLILLITLTLLSLDGVIMILNPVFSPCLLREVFCVVLSYTKSEEIEPRFCGLRPDAVSELLVPVLRERSLLVFGSMILSCWCITTKSSAYLTKTRLFCLLILLIPFFSKGSTFLGVHQERCWLIMGSVPASFLLKFEVQLSARP